MGVIMPGVTLNFVKQIFQIAAFDVYETNDMLNDILGIPPTEPYDERIGLDSRYYLNNMGTMLLFYLAYPVLILLKKCFETC